MKAAVTLSPAGPHPAAGYVSGSIFPWPKVPGAAVAEQ